MEKDTTLKVARQRLRVLEMAETLGNISEACRRSSMDHVSFYEWKRRDCPELCVNAKSCVER